MPTRSNAFGSDPTGSGIDQGQIVDPPIPGLDPLKQIARDIAKITYKYVAPETLQPLPFTLIASERKKIDLSIVRHNSFVISVFVGTVDFWIGDFVSGRGDPPHIQVPAGSTIQIQMPDGGRIYTVGATAAGTAAFCFIPLTV